MSIRNLDRRAHFAGSPGIRMRSRIWWRQWTTGMERLSTCLPISDRAGRRYRPSSPVTWNSPGRSAIVHVRGTLPRSDGRISYRPYGKTASARRSLKVPEFLRQALKFHLAGHSNANWVFPAPQGGFLRGDNFRTRSWTPRD